MPATRKHSKHQITPNSVAMEESAAQSSASAPAAATHEATTPEHPPIESAIIEHIATGCPQAFHRHQQDTDPDLTAAERRHLVTAIWQQGPRPFLARFRHSLTAEHLEYFASLAEPALNDTEAYEIGFYVRDSRERLANRARDIRNRRFMAMQRMLLRNSGSSYFGETEMAAREPLLYERLVGQYLTASEKRQLEDGDRTPDEAQEGEGEGEEQVAGGVQFSRVLLDGIAKEHVQERRRQQQAESQGSDNGEEEEDSECSVDEDEEENSGMQVDDEEEEYYPQVPPSFQQHWGDFEEDKPATSANFAPPTNITPKTASTLASSKKSTTVQKSRASVADRRQKYVTAAEKDVLRNEFYATMYESFVEGRDLDFDYAAVDDNADYDDLEQLARDKEDKYFETSDGEDEMEDGDAGDGASEATAALASSSLEDRVVVAAADEESEDELDKYMREINASIGH